MRPLATTLIIAVPVFLLLFAARGPLERRFLFYPSHQAAAGGLTPWVKDGATIGYARVVPAPRNVWLMLHGNAGQASMREYAIPSFAPDDGVFVLEYPGYGSRPGVPSRESFDHAAEEAYRFLRQSYPTVPVCVAAESIGSGPASYLGSLDRPPDKLVLIVPFDRLSRAAAEHFPSFLVSWALKDNWDNVAALAHYPGKVEVYGAEDDTIIPVAHARALAAAVPHGQFVLIEGGHTDWAAPGRIWIRNP